MIINLTFREIGVLAYWDDAEIINQGVQFIMDNLLPEFDEHDVIDSNCSLICDRVSDRVYIEIRPVWLFASIH